jgi:hypothetical protein
MYSSTPLPTSVASGLISRSFLRRYFLLISIAWLALSAETRAVTPAPDGGYAGNNTAEGTSALSSLTSGADNTANGFQALFHNTSGTYNSGEGFRALFSNTTGVLNTATGVQALANNTTANYNTADGVNALYHNTTGALNTATGVQTLFSNTTGAYNTAEGTNALYSNTTASFNTANGVKALFSNTTGGSNTGTGFQALQSNTLGEQNTANGVNALLSNTTGNFNTADGADALKFSSTGSSNTAIGLEALFSNSTGSSNTAIGLGTLFSNSSGFNNTALGVGALNQNGTGAGNLALGINAGGNITSGNNNIDIANSGDPANPTESSTIRIGGGQTRTFIAGIRGVTTGTPNAVNVVIDSNGQLGTVSSSRRYKKDIAPMDNESEAILTLKPVKFRYKAHQQDKTPQFGLIAEDVAAVDPNLVVRDEIGEIYTVRYDAVNAMLLNEFLKEHRKVEQQDARLAKQEAIICEQQKQIEALTATVQKVSDQVALSKPAPRLVANP